MWESVCICSTKNMNSLFFFYCDNKSSRTPWQIDSVTLNTAITVIQYVDWTHLRDISACTVQVCLTLCQIVNVLPQSLEVLVSKSAFRWSSAPGVVLQSRNNSSWLDQPIRTQSTLGHCGFFMSYQQQSREQVNALCVQPGGDRRKKRDNIICLLIKGLGHRYQWCPWCLC